MTTPKGQDMGQMKRALSSESGQGIDVFKPTIGRLSYRLNWGHQAGRKAYARGDERNTNAFRERRHMPMHRGWEEGYAEAQADARAH